MHNIEIYTDGASRGNGSIDSLGGYGIVMKLIYLDKDGKEKTKINEVKKFMPGVTNNYMELLAVVDALSLLKYPCSIRLYSDSKYVCDAISKNWLPKWYMNGWVTSSKEPVANKELWERLIELLKKHNIEVTWVKGHSNNEGNNRCDALANEAIDEYLRNKPKPKDYNIFEDEKKEDKFIADCEDRNSDIEISYNSDSKLYDIKTWDEYKGMIFVSLSKDNVIRLIKFLEEKVGE